MSTSVLAGQRRRVERLRSARPLRLGRRHVSGRGPAPRPVGAAEGTPRAGPAPRRPGPRLPGHARPPPAADPAGRPVGPGGAGAGRAPRHPAVLQLGDGTARAEVGRAFERVVAAFPGTEGAEDRRPRGARPAAGRGGRLPRAHLGGVADARAGRASAPPAPEPEGPRRQAVLPAGRVRRLRGRAGLPEGQPGALGAALGLGAGGVGPAGRARLGGDPGPHRAHRRPAPDAKHRLLAELRPELLPRPDPRRLRGPGPRADHRPVLLRARRRTATPRPPGRRRRRSAPGPGGRRTARRARPRSSPAACWRSTRAPPARRSGSWRGTRRGVSPSCARPSAGAPAGSAPVCWACWASGASPRTPRSSRPRSAGRAT